jgi:hypothetical protein
VTHAHGGTYNEGAVPTGWWRWCNWTTRYLYDLSQNGRAPGLGEP